MRIVCALVLVFGFNPYLNAQQKASRAALYGSLAADLLTQEIASRRGFHEANILLGQSSWRRIPTAAAATILLDRVSLKLGRKWAVHVRFTVASAHLVAAGWNLSGRPNFSMRK